MQDAVNSSLLTFSSQQIKGALVVDPDVQSSFKLTEIRIKFVLKFTDYECTTRLRAVCRSFRLQKGYTRQEQTSGYTVLDTCLTFCPVSIIHMVITEPVQALTT